MTRLIKNQFLVAGALCFTASFAHAHSYYAHVQAKDLDVKGSFSVKVGSPLVVSGFDRAGKAYELTLISKIPRKGFAMLQYKLDRDAKQESGSVMAKIGEKASLNSGQADKEPDISFEAMLSE